MMLFVANVCAAMAEETNSILPMPDRFTGVQLGMKMEEFVKVRTNACSAWQSPGTVNLTRTNQNLREFYNGIDPIWGQLGPTNAFAGVFGLYEFKDDKLNAILFGWVGESGKIRKCRNEFVQTCVKLWGNNYERRATTRNQDSTNSVVPLIAWKKGDVTAIVLLEDYADSKLATSGFGLNIFHTSDEEKAAVFERETFEPETIERLFKKAGVAAVP